MQIFAVNSISATSPGEKETKESSSLFIKEISGGVADIKFRVTLSQRSFFRFFVRRADIFAVPKVVFLITFFVCIVVG